MTTRSISVVKHAALPLALGTLVAYLVCAHGIPLLRHDWGLPQTTQAFPAAWETLFQPLLLRGFGETNPYPTAYLVGFILMPFTLLPPAAFICFFVALATASVAGAGAAVARSLDAGTMAQVACALFATLNPWMYTELVAGHIFMVMSYGFLMWLAAEVLRPEPRPAWLVLWSALLVCQIEFLAFVFVPIVIWFLRRHQYVALFALCVAVVPIAFGIFAHYTDIRQTPFLLEWQVSQSIAIFDALTFRGYFAQYASTFAPVAPALWLIAATACTLTMLAFGRKWHSWPVLLVGACAALLATGTKWIIAPLYTFAVLHAPEVGLFRELYDLLALTAIAYTVALALAGRTHRWASILSTAACMALTYAWVADPPYRHFVPQHLIPAQHFSGTDRERVALFPAQQPLQLRDGEGSGYDPDLFYQPGYAAPINSYFPAFPQVRALAAAQTGDYLPLAALSVRYIIGRPYLKDNTGAQGYEMIVSHRGAIPHSQTITRSYPMLGLVAGYPSIVSVGQSSVGNGIFYGDAKLSSRFDTVSAPRFGTNAESGWIDARLAYARYPQLATRFGGAFTFGITPLPLRPGTRDVLAWTNGTLRSDRGRIVAAASNRLQWYSIGNGTRSLVCSGACMVSGIGNAPTLPAEAPAQYPHAVDFSWITPWLVRAQIPDHPDSTLRWNIRYERSWMLFGVRARAHVDLDQSINGWLLPRGTAAGIYLLNVSAATQMALEVFGFVLICMLLWRTARNA